MSVDFRLARIFCVTAPIHLREPTHCDVSCREPVSSQAHLQNLGRLRPIDRDSDSVTYVNTLRSSSRSNRTSDTKISFAMRLRFYPASVLVGGRYLPQSNAERDIVQQCRDLGLDVIMFQCSAFQSRRSRV